MKWDEREAVRSGEIQDSVRKRVNYSIVNNKVDYLSFHHRLLHDLNHNFDININNVNNLDKVIKGALLLQGEDTDRVEQRGVWGKF